MASEERTMAWGYAPKASAAGPGEAPPAERRSPGTPPAQP
eukprot:CAMPEP_0206269756 /NCGR_PEP_ID=MMETSP0047_2-20121206/32480_1 /ASSEMBLY_ACC=CAM_ASM_000192 /TAXON_ID=195065 /ORGANISM="Chroomonas mesostigmatica_cf, Strain CCMP1168" /LENGTH=39 /DNA_ID= /DNA_START= /DNA_END= /DNA_ORIENTATION=